MRLYIKILTLIILLLVTDMEVDAARRKKQNVDTMAIGCRGVMESFANVTDGIESRLQYYSSKGYNRYFYSPSDDRYCNRWGWKFLYNDSDRHQLKQLRQLCSKNNLEFVWTVNPGERYSWNETDYKFLYDKLVMMYYNGIRAFAVNFTDSDGRHVAVRDSLVRNFVPGMKEKVSLYIINDIPVLDYPSEVEPAMSLMKGYHFDKDFAHNAEKADAVICNLASSDEFAKFALTAVSSFAANPDAYSPDQTLVDSINSLQENAKDAFGLFLCHTGGYDESVSVETFKLEDWSQEKAAKLYEEFDKIERVPAVLADYTNSSVMEALQPWLQEFGRLGTRGKVALDCMKHYMSGRLSDFWTIYSSARMTSEQMESYAKYPVGSAKLHPFCLDAMAAMKKGFSSMLTGQTTLHNLASTLLSAPNEALDSDLYTSVSSHGHMEFSIPALANTCHLLLSDRKPSSPAYFRQIATDGRLLAEFVITSPYMSFDIKTGAVKVDIIGGDVDIYECIFVYL